MCGHHEILPIKLTRYIFSFLQKAFLLDPHKKEEESEKISVDVWVRSKKRAKIERQRGNLLSLFWYIALYHSRKPANERNFYFFQSECRFHFPSFTYTHIWDEKLLSKWKIYHFYFQFFPISRYRNSWLNSFWSLMKWEWHQFDWCDVALAAADAMNVCWLYMHVSYLGKFTTFFAHLSIVGG